MLEVYDMIELGTPLAVKIAWYVFAISIFVALFTSVELITSKHPTRRKEIISVFWTTSLGLIVISGAFLIFSKAWLDTVGLEGNKLSKDQYTLNLINQQIIKPANDKHQMRIDNKDFDALKIVTETNKSYIVEGDSKDKSLHKTLELKKSDYNIERK